MNLVRFVSEQPPYNLLDRRIENELIPLAQQYNLAILPWSPLAGGILAGRYDDGIPEGSRGARSGAMFRDRISERGVEVARAGRPDGQRKGPEHGAAGAAVVHAPARASPAPSSARAPWTISRASCR